MSTELNRELKELQMTLLEMATLVEEALRSAMEALVERNTEPALAVIDGDARIDELEIRIDEESLRLLALRQPLAVDLRFITSIIRINADIERVGDLAVNIAERAVELNERPPLPFQVEIEALGNVALTMLQDAINSFISKDTRLAREVCKRDDEADALATEIVHKLLDQMMKDTPAIRRAVSMIIIDRALERVADLATNICEATIMYAEGKSIKHHHFE
ncbi:MAG: phosphate signaling complex protein PhoU [Deltaproteobacteria bacterium]|nr:phosphate signaling complex protein PhoU [Deltaproteobacteria bacterium]